MKALTETGRQWLWFAALWCGGLAGTAMLAAVVRWALTP
jgi:hypothetical protein